MRKMFCLLMALLFWGNAYAMNATADMVRNCERVLWGTPENYILKCTKSDKIASLIGADNSVRQFFVADNNGDVRGTFLAQVSNKDEYVYVHVASNLKDMRYENQTCYRFITELDDARDGFYAIEICEYERPDYYL